MKPRYDAAVVGSGPNGLAAAIALAQRGLSVVVYESAATVGGGARSAELTLPGFVHDICSAIHPMAMASPFLQSLPLDRHGLRWIQPPAALAHPLDDEPAVLVQRSLPQTAAALGIDGPRYERLVRPFVDAARDVFHDFLAPPRLPRRPLLDARFGVRAIQSAWRLSQRWFRTARAKALFAGLAGHSVLPLTQPPSAAVGLMLLIAAHACGWPLPQGGAQSISEALASHFRSLGGEIRLDYPVVNVDELPQSRVILLDLTPRQVLRLAGQRFTPRYRRSLERYRYGPGVFKVDWALQRPIPWNDAACAQAATVHIGGTIEEIADSEAAAWDGRLNERPFVLVAQPTLFDPSRAPPGKHTAWAYCHVPNGSPFDMLAKIEGQLERFAAGFRDCILARSVLSPAALERHNPNCVGGDITGGAQDLRQLFGRPIIGWRPYRTAAREVYICSASTPPGGGVHGMCGYFAAQTAINDHFC
jgi:phytoene dehydrogenase-like protein